MLCILFVYRNDASTKQCAVVELTRKLIRIHPFLHAFLQKSLLRAVMGHRVRLNVQFQLFAPLCNLFREWYIMYFVLFSNVGNDRVWLYAKFDVLIAVLTKIQLFWFLATGRFVKNCRLLDGDYLRLQSVLRLHKPWWCRQKAQLKRRWYFTTDIM